MHEATAFDEFDKQGHLLLPLQRLAKKRANGPNGIRGGPCSQCHRNLLNISKIDKGNRCRLQPIHNEAVIRVYYNIEFVNHLRVDREI